MGFWVISPVTRWLLGAVCGESCKHGFEGEVRRSNADIDSNNSQSRKTGAGLAQATAIKGAVKVAIKEILDQLPKGYSTEVYQRKFEEVYQHIYESYSGARRSSYNTAA